MVDLPVEMVEDGGGFFESELVVLDTPDEAFDSGELTSPRPTDIRLAEVGGVDTEGFWR